MSTEPERASGPEPEPPVPEAESGRPDEPPWPEPGGGAGAGETGADAPGPASEVPEPDVSGREPEATLPAGSAAPAEPRLVVFDVNETLTDMATLGPRFRDIGAPAHLLPVWFAGVLRDGFALAAHGTYADFAVLAEDGLRALLDGLGSWEGDASAAVRHVLDGLPEVDVHPDVPEAVRTLQAAGLRLMTLTNGSAATTRAVLGRAELLDCFEAHLDVSAPRSWKPDARAYRHAVEYAGVPAEDTVLVSVHPWDVDGARRAGLAAAWVRRGVVTYPGVMRRAPYEVAGLDLLADALAARTG